MQICSEFNSNWGYIYKRKGQNYENQSIESQKNIENLSKHQNVEKLSKVKSGQEGQTP